MEEKNHSGWIRMRFKRNKVWVSVDAQDQPIIRNGKVLIKYQLNQSHEYWVNSTGVTHLSSQGIAPEKMFEKQKAASGSSPGMNRSTAIEAPVTSADPKHAGIITHSAVPDTTKAIHIYTDGACSGNPGPAGIGVVLRYKKDYKEISRYIGEATNNVAELEAIRTGLKAVKNPKLPVVVFTDSNYAYGLLTQGWKAKQNQDIVEEIRQLITTFKALHFVKVKGHAGHPENERADRLAVQSLNKKTQNP